MVILRHTQVVPINNIPAAAPNIVCHYMDRHPLQNIIPRIDRQTRDQVPGIDP